MIANNVHQALAQVRQLKAQVLDNQRFTGYSGRVRMVCGAVALAGAVVLATGLVPRTPMGHLAGWFVVFLVSILLNQAAMLYWFLFDPRVKRDVRKLKPVLEMVPPLAVGALISAALVLHGQMNLLFGTWMCCYGLANIATRHVIPHTITWVGLFYLVAGAVCLLLPGISFLNPWPMGIVFGIGELAGGLVLHFDQTRSFPVYRNWNPEP